jgi:hypothetical protein
MDSTAAISILTSLAAGHDPETGEVLSPSNPLQRPDTVRALYTALASLRRSLRSRTRDGGPPRSGHPWSEDEEARLAEAFSAGTPISDLARDHGRSASAIHNRLVTLGLVEAPVD